MKKVWVDNKEYTCTLTYGYTKPTGTLEVSNLTGQKGGEYFLVVFTPFNGEKQIKKLVYANGFSTRETKVLTVEFEE